MPDSARLPWLLLIVLWLAGTLRAFALWSHDPLYAYANSYDETRYTTCFHFYPDRAPDVEPQQNSPEAPYSRFRFVETDDPMCYWSSELAFGAATTLIWKTGEALTGATTHDARWIGALRWAALLVLSVLISRAWMRRRDVRAAIANAALVPLVFADPGNTLYLDTFYAEWTALLAAYALIAALLIWRDEARSRARFAWLALAALALATSKLQHMLLPLVLALVVFALDRWHLRRTTWRFAAVALGAIAGLYFQFVQLQREGLMMDTIRNYNSADVVFTALTPFADDPRALLEELGIDPGCAIYSGKRAWQLPDLPQRACRGLGNFSRGKEIAALLRHPGILVALIPQSVLALDPWIAQNIGHVEGAEFGKIPPSVPSIGYVLHAYPGLQLALLAAPLLALIVFLFRQGVRAGSRGLESTALLAATMAMTLTIAVLGDGLADTAKQGHLVINAALVWLVAGTMMGTRMMGTRTHRSAAPPAL